MNDNLEIEINNKHLDIDVDIGKTEIYSENDYNKLINKPSINDVELKGNKTSEDLNLQSKITKENKLDYNLLKNTPTKTSDFTNDGEDGSSPYASQQWVLDNEIEGKIDVITRNGEELPIVDKTVNIEVPTKPEDIEAEPSFTKNTAFNKNFETNNDNIKMDGEANVGSSSNVARADHIHPTDTSRASQSDMTKVQNDINTTNTNLSKETQYRINVDNHLQAQITSNDDDISNLKTLKLDKSKADKNLMNELAISANNDNVTLDKSYINLSTEDTSSESINMPLANDTTAGLMSKADYAQIRDNTAKIEQLEGQNIRLLYTTSENPTSSQIEQFVKDSGYTDSSQWIYIGVVVQNTNHIWRYYSNTFEWKDIGADTVNIFTNEIAGIIKGSSTDGKVYAETDGTGSVYGWDALNTKVVNNTNNINTNKTSIEKEIVDRERADTNLQTQINEKQSTITGGATTIVNDNLIPNKVLISNEDGKVASSDISNIELNYLNNVTSNIQEQLNNKQTTLTSAQQNAVNSGITSDLVAQINTNTTNINNKVDKETGKGLSSNDFTTGYKNQIDTNTINISTNTANIEKKLEPSNIKAGNNIEVSTRDKDVTINATVPSIYQTVGANTDGAMSQKATTDAFKEINKLYLKNFSTTSNGVTYTLNENEQTFLVNGTSSAQDESGWSETIEPFTCKAGKTYKLQLYVLSGTADIDGPFSLYNSKKGRFTNTFNLNETKTFTEDFTYDSFRTWVSASGKIANNYKIKIQLCEDGISNEWQYPYGEISHKNDANMQFANEEYEKSKNMLYEYGTQTTKSGVVITVDEESQTILFNGTSTEASEQGFANIKPITLKANKTYTMSFTEVSGSSTGNLHIIAYDTDRGLYTTTMTTSKGSPVGTITPSEDLSFNALRIYWESGWVFTNYKVKLQVEEKSEATEWQYPYGKIVHENDIPISKTVVLYDKDTQNTIGGTSYPNGLSASSNIKYEIDLSIYKEIKFLFSYGDQNGLIIFIPPFKNTNNFYAGAFAIASGTRIAIPNLRIYSSGFYYYGNGTWKRDTSSNTVTYESLANLILTRIEGVT